MRQTRKYNKDERSITAEAERISTSGLPGGINFMDLKNQMENGGTDPVLRLRSGDREILIVGTAHVSKHSAELVARTIESEKPDTVCVELCDSRYQAISQKDRWRDMDIVKVIKEKKTFLLLANLLLASFQKRIARQLDIQPGQEMIQAIDSAKTLNAAVCPVDRDIRITLSRTWRMMRFRDKIKLFIEFIGSAVQTPDIRQEDIERMKQADALESILADVEKELPALRDILIDERDQYLAQKIRTAPGKKIVAVVGAGHVPGIQKYWHQDIDTARLEVLPPKGKLNKALKWILPAVILMFIAGGFYAGGFHTGADMVKWWFLANGILAGAGAMAAFAHPLTIISSVLAAPLTSLNPMIAAGWVSGLVEAVFRKPRVKDLESLADDILSIKGFWRNKVTRILLVVVFTNLGSALGTFVAIPLMVKAF